ncbi:MAG: DUF192 domain-containing protein [Armatimonadetes bacterium]|nr:DUF192 domain-containing protein [Armatimonadota bacterium]
MLTVILILAMRISPVDATPVLTANQISQSQDKDQDQEPRFNVRRTHQLKDLQKEEIKLGPKLEHKLKIWVMDTELKRQEGMMFLELQDVSEKQGMIFVFRREYPLSFWMMNTLIALDIAYLDEDGVIVKIYTMKPLDTVTDYGSGKYAKYALEVRAGLFKKLKVEVGQKIEIPDTVKAKG